MQIVLNVLLFVPLGYFLRVILHRGVVVATVAGFGLSLLIELTQKTGVWHLYSCAYRLFDVDDLIVNTLGATVGSLLSILVVRRRAGKVVLPTTISFGRRLVGFACDVLFIALTGAAAALAYRGIEIYLRDVPPLDVSRHVQAALQWGVPFAVEAVLVLGFGRTVGEWVVSLHTVPRTAAAARAGPPRQAGGRRGSGLRARAALRPGRRAGRHPPPRGVRRPDRRRRLAHQEPPRPQPHPRPPRPPHRRRLQTKTPSRRCAEYGVCCRAGLAQYSRPRCRQADSS